MAMDMNVAAAMSYDELNEKLTEVAFEIIANVGTARGMYVEAIQAAKTGDFEQAQKLITEGKEIYAAGHHAHADVLTMQANGIHLPSNIYLMHAEDQLMAADSFETVALELIEVHKELANIKAER